MQPLGIEKVRDEARKNSNKYVMSKLSNSAQSDQ